MCELKNWVTLKDNFFLKPSLFIIVGKWRILFKIILFWTILIFFALKWPFRRPPWQWDQHGEEQNQKQ